MSKAYPHATVSRVPGKPGKPDVIQVNVLDPALDKHVLKGTFASQNINAALEFAGRLAETVGRIGV